MKIDIVFIKDLRVETVIGVYDWERKIKQTVHIDLDMASDTRPAASSDSIQDALDYKAVSDCLKKLAAESNVQLLETLAERMAQTVMQEFNVPWLKLRLDKPAAVSGAAGVGVIIERGERI